MTATRSPRERELAAFIATLETRYTPLHVAGNLAAWNLNVTGEPRWSEESERCKLALHDLLGDSASVRFLTACRDSGEIADPLLARQLTLLLHEHLPHQTPRALHERVVRLETRLESAFNAFRAEFGGERVTDNRLRQVLRESNDAAERRAAWEATKQVGAAIAGELLELVRLRNEAARALGHRDHYAMTLALDEIDETELFALLDRIETGTRTTWRRYKDGLDATHAARFGVAADQLRPWHHADPFFQEAPSSDADLDGFFQREPLETIARRFFAAVGLTVDGLLERADLYEKPGKCQHAFCMCLDRRDDIRVLCNLRPNEYWMATLLHEFGHGVYDERIERTLPFFLRAHAHILTTEASAMLFGRLTRNPEWLVRWAGATRAEAEQRASRVAAAARDQLLVAARWNLVMSHFERALYADPERDLSRLWWDLVERFQGVRRPDDRAMPDWASKIHFSVAPVYYHNYLLGEIMASQLQAHLCDVVLGGADAASRYVDDPAVGAWLTRAVYAGGRTRDWRDTLVAATGRPLDPAAFVAELSATA